MHDFVEIAGAFRTQIEEAVTDLFTPAGLLTGDEIPAPLAEVMRYALRTPGKRLRPVLCLAACTSVSGDAAPALPLGRRLSLGLISHSLRHRVELRPRRSAAARAVAPVDQVEAVARALMARVPEIVRPLHPFRLHGR